MPRADQVTPTRPNKADQASTGLGGRPGLRRRAGPTVKEKISGVEWQRGDEGAEGAEYAETVVRGSRKNMRINNGRWGGGWREH